MSLDRATALGICLGCDLLVAACGGTVAIDQERADSAASVSVDALAPDVVHDALDWIDAVRPPDVADGGDASPSQVAMDAEVDTSADGADWIVNFVELATCEGDPDEVAVRGGAAADPCSEVTAIAWHVDADVAVKVPSTFTWSVEDPAVAQLVPAPGHEHGATRRLVTGIDVFAAESDEEPGSVMTACATPEWAAPGSVEPVCGTLPVQAVVSLAGTWCFEGGPFGAGCTPLVIAQNGRYLLVDATGQGTVYGRHLDFYYSAFEFQSDLSSPDAMTGSYSLAGTTDVLGQWSATRLGD